MGVDDGRCDDAPDGLHDFVLTGVEPAGRAPDVVGIGLVRVCERCGVVAYEASARDDPRREDL